MKNMKRLIVFVLTLLIIGSFFTQAMAATEVLYDSYKGQLGIEIRSYSPNWTGDKLKEVYEELLNNTHGEEIEYLSTINLYPDNPFGGEEEGLYHGAYQSNLFLNKTNYKTKKNRVIDLFNMIEKESVNEIAKTLSHEYGHHFTFYYILKGENKTFDEWRDTKYAKIRGLTDDTRVRHDYSNGHQWNITEIAAEDYIQLYGSINAKIPSQYDDIILRAEKQTLDEIIKWNNHIFNVYPQENFNIPLANNVSNLQQYWTSISGVDVDKYNEPPTGSVVGLTEVKNLGHDKKQFIIRWTESEDRDSSNLLYTLVAYDQKQHQVIPIKTINQGEELVAVIGSTKIINQNEIIFYSDIFIDEPKNIRVFTMDEHGNIVSSNIIVIDFNNPVITELHQMENIQERITNEELENNMDVFIDTQNDEEEKGWLDNFFDLIISLIERFI